MARKEGQLRGRARCPLEAQSRIAVTVMPLQVQVRSKPQIQGVKYQLQAVIH